MEIRYVVPKHLEEYVANVTPDDMSKLLTILLDIAVEHRMFEYPTLGIERDVSAITKTLQNISSRLNLNTSTLDMYFTTITDKLNTLLERQSTPISVPTGVPDMSKYEIDYSNIPKCESSDAVDIDDIDDTDIIF